MIYSVHFYIYFICVTYKDIRGVFCFFGVFFFLYEYDDGQNITT